MAPVRIAEHVAHGVKIRAGYRTGDGARRSEEASDADLRKRMRALDRELRPQIAHGRLRQIHAAGYIARIAQPYLVGQT